MSFDINEILQKLQEIQSFANKVAETKRLADQLAENFAKMKVAINETINRSFAEIADQIDTLRKNMELMESVQSSSSSPSSSTTPPPAPPEPEPKPEAPAPPTPPPAPPTPPPAPPPAPPEPEVSAPPTVSESAPVAEEAGDELEFLNQQKDRLKAELTDLRFDYMRGYIPEEQYKAREAELDAKLKEIEKKISALR